jgi:hypothetical protein
MAGGIESRPTRDLAATVSVGVQAAGALATAGSCG